MGNIKCNYPLILVLSLKPLQEFYSNYGEGEKLAISKIRTSGVHISDEGSISVLADDDDFECIACGSKTADTLLCALWYRLFTFN